MRTMHLFAGGGGGLLADLILGHNPICAVEWEPYACQILRERAADGWFPNLHVHEGDIRLFDPSEYAGRVDCIHAGFPCQDISVAGKQAGLGEGTRSGLYREVLRIAGIVRPPHLFLENVSAIRSKGLETVLADLAALGYDSRWCCIRASDVGAPHGRDRWWLKAEQMGNAEHNGCATESELRSDETASNQRRAEEPKPSGQSERTDRPADVSGIRGCQSGSERNEVCNTASERLSQRTVESLGRSVAVTEFERPDCKNSNAISEQDNQQRELGELGRNTLGRKEKTAQCENREASSDRVDGLREDVSDSVSNRLQGARCDWSTAGQAGLCSGARSNQEQSLRSEYLGRETESGLGGMAHELAAHLVPHKTFQGWWEVEPNIGRTTNLSENRAAMLKCLGNGQVPLQAAIAWRLLMRDKRTMKTEQQFPAAPESAC